MNKKQKVLIITIVLLGYFIILVDTVDCKFNPNFWTNLSA
ncbi:hypothetical protein CCLMGIMDO_CCLMGIMDO_01004 [Companilactobacillus crustorum]